VREQMQAEIDKYKRETEEAVARSVAEMKAALEARLREKIELETDKERLEALVSQLQGHVNELQAQVGHLPPTTCPHLGPRGDAAITLTSDCFVHFARLANTLLKDEESARHNHVLACNFAKYSTI